MKEKLKILNLEDNPNDHELIRAKLDEEGIEHEITRVETREAFIDEIEKGGLDLILADNKLPTFDGLSALEIVKEKGVDIPFIFVTGSMGEELAVETLKRGATDYVLKDRMFCLGRAVKRALHEAEEKAMRRNAEEALKESEERFRSVVETAADAIICLKEPDTVYFWNKKAENIFGYTVEEAMAKYLHELIVTEDCREKASQGLKNFFQAGTGPLVGKTVEVTALHKDGTEFPVELSISAMKIRGKWHATGIIRDITERKKAEEKLKEQLDELLRFQKATVQREFRMKELKDRIKELEEKISRLEEEDDK